jgi:SPP1 family predicted phage head-tail adaptor
MSGADEFAGRLRHRLVLEAPVRAADGAGGTMRTWQAVATLWAALEPVPQDEAAYADRLTPGVRYRVLVRRRSGLTAEHRLRWGDRVLAIVAVAPDQGGDRVQLVCVEGAEQ